MNRLGYKTKARTKEKEWRVDDGIVDEVSDLSEDEENTKRLEHDRRRTGIQKTGIEHPETTPSLEVSKIGHNWSLPHPFDDLQL